MRFRQLLLATTAVALLAAACSSTESATPATETSTTAAASTPGTTAGVAATSSTTTTTEPVPGGDDCRGDDEGPLPDFAIVVRAIDADLDGGDDERIVTYGTGTEADPRPWKLRILFDSSDPDGGYAEETLPVETDFGGVRPLGVTPGGLIVMAVDAGASTTVVTAAILRDCRPALPSLPGRSGPALMAVGGTVSEASGLGCETDDDGREELVLRTASSDDGELYRWQETRLSQPPVGEASYAEGETESGELVAADDPGRLGEFYSLTCPGVEPL